MAREWYIGALSEDAVGDGQARRSTADLTVAIEEAEYDSLREAAAHILAVLQGVLYRLVFANYHSLTDHVQDMWTKLTSPDRRGMVWLTDEPFQTQLAFANWLSSVRWFLDHTKTRLDDQPAKLKRFEDATHMEFDNHFAYRLTYKLRDYSTHCDFPPIAMHVESRNTPNGRDDLLALRLRAEDLLESWDGWGAKVTSDLRALQQPLDLLPLVDEAMTCIERVMHAILAADAPDHLAAARQVVEAGERLPTDALERGAGPMLFSAEVENETSIPQLSPFPLPIEAAREILDSASHTVGPP